MKTPSEHTGRSNIKKPKASRLFLSLRTRLLKLYAGMVILPLLLLFIFFFIMTANTAEKDFGKHSAAILRSLEYRVGQFAADTGVFEEKVEKLLAQTYSGNADGMSYQTTAAEGISALIRNETLKTISANLQNIYLINGNSSDVLYSRNKNKYIIGNPTGQEWYVQAVGNRGKPFFTTCIRFMESGSGLPVFSMAKAVKPATGSPGSAVLLFDFDIGLLNGLVDTTQTNLPSDCEIFILDECSRIIYNKNQTLLTLEADPSIRRFQSGTDSAGDYRTGKLSYSDRNWYSASISSKQLSWNFLCMIPSIKAVAYSLQYDSGIMLPVLAVLLAAFLLFPAALLRLLNPINKLTSVISGYDNTAAPFRPKSGEPRKQTSSGLFESSSDLDYLIDKVYTLNLRQKEAELNALQNQINPHFLYNTLESIRGAALYHGIHDIAAMSKALSLMFRYSINSTVLVSVKDEIQHLENYMSIQNFRYENKFELIYDIPPDFTNYKILKLTLQPLIENSIKHGLEMKLGKGTIKVMMFKLDNNFHIQVSDDGTGIPPKRVEELNRMLERDEFATGSSEAADKQGTGIGVKNVNSRLKLYFGEAYGLKFMNTTSGTLVEIILPAVIDNPQ